jgi:diguanylate cyclase (GGDEF)-like protein/PAS domain S-box-containing protein
MLVPLGVILTLLVLGAPATTATVTQLHKAQPLLFIIDAVPLILGVCVAAVGVFRERAAQVQAAIEHDLAARQEAEAARRRLESRFRAIFDHAAIGIVLLDGDGYFCESNLAFQTLVGYSREELIHLRASELSPPEDAALTREPIRELRAGLHKSISVEKRFIRKDGTILLCTLTVSPMTTADNTIGFVGMLQDITERRKLESELAYQAWHDLLTGLANRARLVEQTEVALAENESASHIALLYVDLDGFKSVNDSLGHSAGDALLKVVATRLLDATRGSDTVARLGGDEFAVLLPSGESSTDAIVIARRILNAVAHPISLDGQEVTVSASIGVAHARADDDAETLLRNADLAMYRAKMAGRARSELFVPEMHAAVHARLALETDLRRALESDQFSLAYQPIIETTTGRIAGVEALLRWTHPTRGAVSPAEFIPVAERIGLIGELGRWTLRTACAQGAQWLASLRGSDAIPTWSPELVSNEPPPFYLAVNVSSRQLQDDSIIIDVANALAATRFDPRCLVLEITESVIMQDVEGTLARLHDLKALGLRLAVDDFGTGYSSLSYLQRLPIDVMKVDRSFVRGIGASGHSESLVRTVVALGEMLGMSCVAEGVETAAQHEFLTSLGCAYAQGYRYGRPVGADVFQQAWVHEQTTFPLSAVPHAAPTNLLH